MTASKDNQLRNFQVIIQKSLEGSLTPEEGQILHDTLLENADARRHYIDYMTVHSSLFTISEEILTRTSSQCVNALNEEMLRLSKYENIAPAIDIPEDKPVLDLIQKIEYPRREKQKITKFQLLSFFMSAAAILFVVFFLNFMPDKRYHEGVATVVDQVGAEWADSSTGLNNGDSLWINERPLNLQKGIVNILYHNGVDVLVEGPAIFKVERTGIFLDYGRLYSRVPDTGYGFTVHTPTSQFVDMGTEFGVQANINGSSELHVIKGRVQVFAGSEGNSKFSQLVTENEAARYDIHSNSLQMVPVQSNAFVRQINSQSGMTWRGQTVFSLADVLGGGNGFGTGKLRHGVSLKNSQIEKIVTGKKIEIMRDFVPVESPFIDRYFTPRHGKEIQVSSNGDVFSDFPSNTKTNLRGAFYEKAFRKNGLYTLNYKGRSSEDLTSVIRMHSNAGLTFSIENIRNSLPPNIAVTGFTAECSIPSDVLSVYNKDAKDNQKGKLTYPKVDVIVLIDGEDRFQRRNLIPDEGIVPVDIEIKPEDRTLTLVVTDSGTTTYDWLIFANPSLKLTARQLDSELIQ